jgi:hypothetical protein
MHEGEAPLAKLAAKNKYVSILDMVVYAETILEFMTNSNKDTVVRIAWNGMSRR